MKITALKMARYPELLDGPLRPIHWDIDPSSVCDHTCGGCPYIYTGDADPMLGVKRLEMAKPKRGFLDFDRYVQFVTDVRDRGCRAVTFVGGGEPTLHPRFTEMMEVVADAGIKFGVITHFGRDYQSARFFDALARATWVRVSLNAGYASTYEKLQGRDHFDAVLENMAVAAARGVNIGASFLVTPENQDEISMAAWEVARHGGKYLQIKPHLKHDASTMLDGIDVDATRADIVTARGFTSARGFEVLDQWSSRLEQVQAHARGEFAGRCHIARFNPKLGANGFIYVCCELAYADRGVVGSIAEEPIDVLLQRAGAMVLEQSKCPQCWAKPINQAINAGTFSEITPPRSDIDDEFV